MQATIYQKPNPISPKVKDLLTKFNAMIELGFTKEQILENVVKDELFIIAMFFREKCLFTEGIVFDIKSEDLNFDYEEVENG